MRRHLAVAGGSFDRPVPEGDAAAPARERMTAMSHARRYSMHPVSWIDRTG